MKTFGQLLPPLTYQRNPVDTGRPGPTFDQVLAATAADPAVDALVVYALHEPDVLDAPAVLPAARAATGLPILFATGGPRATLEPDSARLRAAGVPVFTAPERAARAARALVADARARHRLELEGSGQGAARRPRPPVEPERLGPTALDEDQAKRLLEAWGIRTPRRWVRGQPSPGPPGARGARWPRRRQDPRPGDHAQVGRGRGRAGH